ncbi:hemagglutinin repeat-containing protein, partial [Achromobacter sp. Marseille-Q0513]|uniref:DUF6862 domain-containing protein n=1 Tax=Achromobacter sp. Marseille-Q0513 TaxID=2829161 RepID=UPI001BA22299
QSGGDTTFKGASGKAEQIIASVGSNLLLESLQDTSKYDAKNQSAGIGASICLTGTCTSSISANAGAGQMKSDFKSVTEQTGLWAGDGGFLIDVKSNTTLIGSVIASSDKAVADGLNKLSTGTLVTEDVKNKANYSAYQVSVGGGIGLGGGDKSGGTGLGTTKDNQVAGGASKEASTSLPSSGNVSIKPPMVAAASGSGSSTTGSAISGGTIVIRDEAGQQALTGKTAAETIASLNRDTSDTLNALKPIFDKEKIQAGFDIMAEASRQTGQFLTNRAEEADALERAYKAETNPVLKEQLKAEYQDALKWTVSGEYGRTLSIVMGAASGNVTGSAGEFVQRAAVSYLQALGTAQVKEVADALNSEVARAALQGLVGCAGAAAQRASCTAGASGAAASVVLNNLLDSWSGKTAEGLTAEEKQTHTNIITSLVAGVGAALGGDSRVAALAAQIETENNYLGQIGTDSARSEQVRYDRLMSECQKGIQNSCEQAKEMNAMSEQRDKALTVACFQPGSLPCQIAVKQVMETGNIVLFGNKEGTPVVYPANTPIIQATPDVRGGSFQGTLSNSVAEGLAIDSSGFALGGILVSRAVLQAVVRQAEVSALGGSVLGKVGSAERLATGGTVGSKADSLLPNLNTRVLTETEARALTSENKGLIYVAESPKGNQAAQNFQAGTSGAYTDLATGKLAVPALRYNNPKLDGINFVKFDGIEKAADGSAVLLIDAKTKLAIWNQAAQESVLSTLRRVRTAVEQNPGYKVIYEFPNAKVEAQANKFIRDNDFDKIITTRVRAP